MSQLEDLMKKCFDFVPMNQIKNPKVQSIKQSTNESNDLLNYCDLRLKALLVKECTLLLFEIEQVLAQGWTNQTLTGLDSMTMDSFVSLKFVSHDANLNDLPNKFSNDYGPSKRNVPDLQATVLIFQLHQSMNESNQHTAGWQTPNGCQKSGVTCETSESSSQSINQSSN